jgi:hypothetical protein
MIGPSSVIPASGLLSTLLFPPLFAERVNGGLISRMISAGDMCGCGHAKVFCHLMHGRS